MPRFVVLSAILICAVSFTRAQDTDLPLCSAEQWERMEEILPRFDEMDALMNSVETEKDFLGYFSAALTLRNDLWREPPLCEPYIEIATLVGQILNDNIILNPMYWFYTDDSDTARLLVGGEWSASEFAYLLGLGAKAFASHLGLGPWEPSDEDDAIPATCSEAQKQRLIGEKRQAYLQMLRAAMSVDTVEDLLQYDDDQLAFRVTAFEGLPLCAEAYDAAQRVTHISSDFVAAHALAFSGAAPASSPSLQQILASIEQLPAWIIPAEFRDPERVRRLFDNNLPACTEAQLVEVAGISHPRFGSAGEFGESDITEATLQQIVAYAKRDIAWRGKNLPLFPQCAEAYELAMLLSQTGADVVAAAAISVSGAPRVENLYHDQALRGVDALQLRLTQLTEIFPESKSADAGTDTLPPCTVPQLRVMGEMVFVPFSAAAQIAVKIDGTDAFGRYAEAQFAWRTNNLRYLPACSGAIDLAYLLNNHADNTATAYALALFAQVVTEDNPYLVEMRAFRDRFDPLMAGLVAQAPELKI